MAQSTAVCWTTPMSKRKLPSTQITEVSQTTLLNSEDLCIIGKNKKRRTCYSNHFYLKLLSLSSFVSYSLSAERTWEANQQVNKGE